VGWTGPGISAITVVPGSVLSPFTPEATLSGTYRITARHSSKALDVTNSSTADGANVQQWTANGTTAQQWIITAATDGHYRIVNKGSNKALEVAGNGTTDGANVQQWSYVGSNSQQWKIEATTDGFFRLLNRHSGKALDVAGVSTSDGANVHQWTYGGGGNQQWKLEQLSTATARVAGAGAAQAAAFSERLLLYPNPVTAGTLHVELGAEEAGNATVVVTNVLGQIKSSERILVKEGQNRFKISTRGLAGGAYVITVSQGSRRTVKKFYVQ
jgi:mannan endo-1,4-beta-mannosidase